MFVLVRLPPYFTAQPSKMVMVANQDVILECKAEGNPEPEWEHY